MLSHYYRDKPNCIAKIEKILTANGRINPRVKVEIRWFYRQEDAIGGRKSFHGTKELFSSDHVDTQSVDTIVEKCNVYSMDEYNNLDKVEENDFFCRFEYQRLTGAFSPESITVYCRCEMPENPDREMIDCENCGDRFHPACLDMTAEMAKQLNHFICQPCLSAMEMVKKSKIIYPVATAGAFW
ncbi:chromatin remodeling protein EBS-like [Rutidosis leptorrhynchoides]|uniref:chromatin remodeling protein EBS-like n=1 Tax=Rutidosis leptorrhynchoides TaxID=125765 RepID=UPI003A99C9A5